MERARSKIKKKLGQIETNKQIITWLKNIAGEQGKNPLEILLRKEAINLDLGSIVIDCFKQLTLTARIYIAFLASGFRQVDIAQFFNISPPAINQGIKKARISMAECLKKNKIESFGEIVEAIHES